jgi:hypothetical protein
VFYQLGEVGEFAMVAKELSSDALSRKLEKHISRELDRYFIEQGIASQGDLAIRNDFFAALDVSSFKISSIGKRESDRDDGR